MSRNYFSSGRMVLVAAVLVPLGSCLHDLSWLFPAGPAGPTGPEGQAGPPGIIGAAGADGKLGIYGNGSAGARVIDANTLLSDSNLQYTDFTVNSGIQLTVASGTVIRCTGTFTNNGIVSVSAGARGSKRHAADLSNALQAGTSVADPGVGTAGASLGELGGNAALVFGGENSSGLSSRQAATILRPGVKAGGAGAGTINNAGESGGGSVTILARTGIVNAAGAEMHADGSNVFMSDTGIGGGAGGVIILASPGTVTNDGLITCDGSSGGGSSVRTGAGGGGGGGIIHLLSPAISNTGATSVAGGLAGTLGALGSVTVTPREGGGAGGGCGGGGGSGGRVADNDDPLAADDGSPGHVILSMFDPTALF